MCGPPNSQHNTGDSVLADGNRNSPYGDDRNVEFVRFYEGDKSRPGRRASGILGCRGVSVLT